MCYLQLYPMNCGTSPPNGVCVNIPDFSTLTASYWQTVNAALNYGYSTTWSVGSYTKYFAIRIVGYGNACLPQHLHATAPYAWTSTMLQEPKTPWQLNKRCSFRHIYSSCLHKRSNGLQIPEDCHRRQLHIHADDQRWCSPLPERR